MFEFYTAGVGIAGVVAGVLAAPMVQFAGLLEAPLSQMASLLAAPARDIASAVQALIDKQGGDAADRATGGKFADQVDTAQKAADDSIGEG